MNVSEVVDAALEGTSATVAAAGFTVERQSKPGLPAGQRGLYRAGAKRCKT